MFIARSDKYNVPGFCKDLVSVESHTGKKLFVERVKYVDVDNDMVFIFNGENHTISPTYGTIRKYGYGAVEARCHTLEKTRHLLQAVDTL